MSSNGKGGSVEDLLQCSICLNSFRYSESREPRMLSCQHTFCTECLRNAIKDERIQCPACHHEFETTVDQLPRNLLVLQLIDRRGSPAENQAVEDQEQILELLYRDPSKTLTALKSLDDEIQSSRKYSEVRVQLSLQCMAYHRLNQSVNSVDILVAGTTYLSHLVSVRGLPVSFPLLGQVADEVLAAAEAFDSCLQLRKNAITILRNERVLTQSEFDLLKASKLALESIEGSLQSAALEILCQLSRRLSREESASMFTENEAKKLLVILDEKLTMKTYDDSLKSLLETLISLTDETPSFCFSITSQNGIYLLSKLLQEISLRFDLKSRVVHILSNISEVPQLRQEIIKHGAIVETLQDLLKTSGIRTDTSEASPLQEIIKNNAFVQNLQKELWKVSEMYIAFNTVAIVAHLSAVPISLWKTLTGKDELRNELLAEIYKCILAWGPKAASTCIMLRSFNPFYELLRRYDAPPAQLFAAWTIWSFCRTDKKYQKMLIDEEGIDILYELRENSYADSNVRKLAKETLDAIR